MGVHLKVVESEWVKNESDRILFCFSVNQNDSCVFPVALTKAVLTCLTGGRKLKCCGVELGGMITEQPLRT